MSYFEGKVIAITGAASGIGLATAHLLAHRGATLSLSDINSDLLTAAASSIRSSHPTTAIHTQIVDVRNRSQVDAWISDTVRTLGPLSGAANIAGVICPKIGQAFLEDESDEDWAFVLDVNLTGVMHCLRAEVKIGEMEEGGAIVNASSVAGLQGRVTAGSYVASKHGVIGLTKTVAKEVGGRGLRVNCIAPGVISTPMLTMHTMAGEVMEESAELKASPLGRAGQPEEVAKLIAFLLSDESSYITGVVHTIDGGLLC
ncbi:related to D-arabinitol 2-dehydrogenase [Phialocephala subalpina]|uniref:Related to D-arabinitol 2-dehydrogenase n=1 Tax=Phialocephala subalpina TaxID=576137 RepID=A0A1L7XJE9_9HELO|nr:related to D-arabinitol 2-dehydrogenase [Phialocephala subalpina]